MARRGRVEVGRGRAPALQVGARNGGTVGNRERYLVEGPSALGDAELVARCTPVLRAMGRAVTHCGAVGAAHAMKALANYVNACALINAIEALTIGKKFGLDPKMMADGLATMCGGRNHPIEKKVIPQVLTRKYATGMALSFIAKDVRIAVDTAHAIGAAIPLGEKVLELWSDAVEKIGAGADQTEVVRYWEQASGVSLTGK